MFVKIPENSYLLTLPTDTSPEVIRWFEEMSAKGSLMHELASMVSEVIATATNSEIGAGPSPETPEQSPVPVPEMNGDFFDGLYNWKESNCQAFKEEGKPPHQQQKRKMLSV